MTENNQIDYTAVLADLENDRDELDTLIAFIKRKKLGQEAGQEGTGTGMIHTRPVTIRTGPGALTFSAPDAFFGLGLIDAAKKYLSGVKAPRSAKEIAQALVSGGFTTTSKDFNNTVFSVLSRENKQDGAIVKVNTGWGLPEWYPGLKRGKSQRILPSPPEEMFEEVDPPLNG